MQYLFLISGFTGVNVQHNLGHLSAVACMLPVKFGARYLNNIENNDDDLSQPARSAQHQQPLREVENRHGSRRRTCV